MAKKNAAPWREGAASGSLPGEGGIRREPNMENGLAAYLASSRPQERTGSALRGEADRFCGAEWPFWADKAAAVEGHGLLVRIRVCFRWRRAITSMVTEANFYKNDNFLLQ